tara:strand:- start:681 stop:1607 length:927 start_codon:yes stop_codon:yes gene_type:complete
MTQDNIQQDTPQENANEQQYTSLEEAVFGEGSLDNTSSAFTSGEQQETETAPETGQPEVSGEENQNNDDKRYQYWQSQADKYKNELDSIKSQQQVQPPIQQQENVQVQPEKTREEFPPPPSKPQRPRTFNREEAYSDSNSESARYLDELEGWRDDMDEYNSLQTQYQTAVMEEKIQSMENERIAEVKRQEAAQKRSRQETEIKEHVMGHYGMNANEAKDFMTKMSDPKSLNIDNLVQLYRMQQGGAQNQSTGNTASPSDAFQQVKKAQQVPSPMGVMPSGNSDIDGKSVEDKIMDTMIGNFDSKNPWK